MNLDDYLTIKQMAAITQRSTRQIKRYINSGTCKAERDISISDVGIWRIHKDEVNRISIELAAKDGREPKLI